MSDMWKETSTLTRVLTTLSHKMVDRSSKRRSGGYESDGGYATDESKKKNSRCHITRGRGQPDKRKSDDLDRKPTKTIAIGGCQR